MYSLELYFHVVCQGTPWGQGLGGLDAKGSCARPEAIFKCHPITEVLASRIDQL